MALGTSAAITAGTGAAMGLGQTISGLFGKKKYQDALDNLEVPELTNAFEGIQISTEGSDLMREENQRNSAMLIDAARSGGVRSVMGSLPALSASNNNANREARAYLDNQVQKKNYSIAQDNIRIQNANENRYLGDVQGLNNMIQANRQDIWSGVRGIGASVMYAGRNLESNGLGEMGNIDGANQNMFYNPFMYPFPTRMVDNNYSTSMDGYNV